MSAAAFALAENSLFVTGEAAGSSILGALTQPFGLDQATADPQRFTAAAQVLIAALKAPHPTLLAVLLGGGLTEPAADKVSLPQIGAQLH